MKRFVLIGLCGISLALGTNVTPSFAGGPPKTTVRKPAPKVPNFKSRTVIGSGTKAGEKATIQKLK